MSNYPDDISQYDNDPRSPFYEPPSQWCSECEWELEEVGYEIMCINPNCSESPYTEDDIKDD